MLPAMLGVVLEDADRDFLEAVQNGWDIDRECIIWKQMRRIGAVRMRIGMKRDFPFVCIRPRLTRMGEEMYLECQRPSTQHRWFIGSDILQ